MLNLSEVISAGTCLGLWLHVLSTQLGHKTSFLSILSYITYKKVRLVPACFPKSDLSASCQTRDSGTR